MQPQPWEAVGGPRSRGLLRTVYHRRPLLSCRSRRSCLPPTASGSRGGFAGRGRQGGRRPWALRAAEAEQSVEFVSDAEKFIQSVTQDEQLASPASLELEAQLRALRQQVRGGRAGGQEWGQRAGAGPCQSM